MSDLTGKRIPKQTLHGSISTSGSSNPLRGYVLTRGFDGKSAYQYAVDGGYEGTEEEFAEKLKELMDGEKGVSSWNDLTDKPFGEDEEGNIQYIDEKYIPNSVARKEDIPTIDDGLSLESTNPVQNNVVTEKLGEKLDSSKLSEAIDTALTKAKESGEFKGDKGNKGDKGDKGYTPIKGEDYFTEADKQEIVDEVVESLDLENVGGAEQVQTDWNQNDPTAPDYVKNRPFYTSDPVETVLFEGVVENDVDVIIDFIGGESYTVIIDDVEYSTIAYELDNCIIVGSESLFNGDEYNESELPFVIGDHWFYTVLGEEDIHLKVVGNIPKIYRIDSKYLPEYQAILVSLDKFGMFISKWVNTNGEFEKIFEDVIGQYDKLLETIKWADKQAGCNFYSFENNCNYYVCINDPNEFTNNKESINISCDHYACGYDGLVNVVLDYTWYKADDDSIWGMCSYDEIVIIGRN